MPKVYASGDNTFGNIIQHCDWNGPIELEGIKTVIAASWCQTIMKTVDDELIVRGQRLSMPDTASTVQCWLGQDNFVAYLDQSGHVCALNGRRSTKVFSHVAVDGHGQLIASTKDDRVMHFSSLDAILADQATLLESKPQPRRIRSIVAGAAHFLILTESPLARVFAYGDNRFGQLGVPPSSSTMTDKSRLHHVDFFDGLEPTTVQASQGGLHSAVITADGSLYVFGDDAKGQCGGHGGHEPACITDDLDEGTIVLDVGLGSAHTCFVTEQESNRYVHYCGTRHEALALRTNHAVNDSIQRMDAKRWPAANRVICSRWNTFLLLEDP